MIRVIECFSGIGSQHAALERLKTDFPDFSYTIVGMAEIDKYAIKSYEAIHGKTHNYGDISKIERLGKADFWTYSFPCQDISVAGKQRGINEGTRSGLLYEVERLLEVAKEHDELPTYLMLENVKNLVGKAFKSDFDKWIGKLNELGYNTYWKVLNAKHYGVPQNRERVFAISIKKEFDMGYMFPEGFDNGIRLKDILEEEVDEKFYISGEKVEKLVSQIGKPKNFKEPEDTYDIKRLGNIYGEDKGTGFAGNVWDKECLSPTIMTMQGGNRQPMIISLGNTNPSGNGMNGNVISSEGLAPTLTTNKGEGQKVLIPQATTKGYIECSVPGVFDMTYPDSKTRRGRVQDHGEIVPTLTAASQDIMYIEGVNKNDEDETNTDKILQGMREEIGEKAFQEWGIGIVEHLQQEEILRYGVYEEKLQREKDITKPKLVHKPQMGEGNFGSEGMLQMWESWEDRYSSQGRGLSKQRIRELDAFMQKLSFEGTQKERCLQSMWRISEGIGVLRKTLSAFQETRKSSHGLQQTGYRIRKLTPKETFRLMGFTDEQFHKAEAVNSNSQLYKQAGNSIVVDVLYHLFKNLFLETDSTKLERQITLFD